VWRISGGREGLPQVPYSRVKEVTPPPGTSKSPPSPAVSWTCSATPPPSVTFGKCEPHHMETCPSFRPWLREPRKKAGKKSNLHFSSKETEAQLCVLPFSQSQSYWAKENWLLWDQIQCHDCGIQRDGPLRLATSGRYTATIPLDASRSGWDCVSPSISRSCELVKSTLRAS
jgi:hypothetical protein